MPTRPLHFCKHAGCNELVSTTYCQVHAKQQEKEQDARRESAHKRGYTAKWSKYSKWFLSQPENQFCKLHLDDGCAVVAQCVDHIDPPDGPKDPRFWDRGNHQAACIHCNSVKGHKKIRGKHAFGG